MMRFLINVPVTDDSERYYYIIKTIENPENPEKSVNEYLADFIKYGVVDTDDNEYFFYPGHSIRFIQVQ